MNNKLEIIETSIPNCYEILPKVLFDQRGSFVKTFHKPFFDEAKLESRFVEQYYSVSSKGVLRGLHFQTPPKEHAKLVCCPFGEVIDVVVDLRLGSPTYGKYEMLGLEQKKGNMIYVPAGLAHGFYVLSEKAIVTCQLTTIYSKANDAGIHWDSVGIPWPNHSPITSKKDKELPGLSEFRSPFVYK